MLVMCIFINITYSIMFFLICYSSKNWSFEIKFRTICFFQREWLFIHLDFRLILFFAFLAMTRRKIDFEYNFCLESRFQDHTPMQCSFSKCIWRSLWPSCLLWSWINTGRLTWWTQGTIECTYRWALYFRTREHILSYSSV